MYVFIVSGDEFQKVVRALKRYSDWRTAVIAEMAALRAKVDSVRECTCEEVVEEERSVDESENSSDLDFIDDTRTPSRDVSEEWDDDDAAGQKDPEGKGKGRARKRRRHGSLDDSYHEDDNDVLLGTPVPEEREGSPSKIARTGYEQRLVDIMGAGNSVGGTSGITTALENLASSGQNLSQGVRTALLEPFGVGGVSRSGPSSLRATGGHRGYDTRESTPEDVMLLTTRQLSVELDTGMAPAGSRPMSVASGKPSRAGSRVPSRASSKAPTRPVSRGVSTRASSRVAK